MNNQTVNEALQTSLSETGIALDKCGLAAATIVFLDELSKSASWWQKLGIGFARDAVSRWRHTNCK